MSYKYFEIIDGVETKVPDSYRSFSTWKNWPLKRVDDSKVTYWSNHYSQITQKEYFKHLNSSQNNQYLRKKLNE